MRASAACRAGLTIAAAFGCGSSTANGGQRSVVPAQAPDSVPQWVGADSSFTGPTRYIPIRFTKNIVGLQFQSEATQSERQSAIDLISGRVIGGYRAAGIYLVWVEDPGDGSGIISAVERLERLPYVAGATPDMETKPND